MIIFGYIPQGLGLVSQIIYLGILFGLFFNLTSLSVILFLLWKRHNIQSFVLLSATFFFCGSSFLVHMLVLFGLSYQVTIISSFFIFIASLILILNTWYNDIPKLNSIPNLKDIVSEIDLRKRIISRLEDELEYKDRQIRTHEEVFKKLNEKYDTLIWDKLTTEELDTVIRELRSLREHTTIIDYIDDEKMD